MDLVSIAPATKAVALGSAMVDVTGLSLRKLTQLLVSFPDLVGVFVGGTLSAATLLQQAPDAALAVFSLGVVGRSRPRWWQRAPALVFDDEQYHFIAAFDVAPAGQQIEALGAIFDITSKGGDRALPFLRAVLARPAAVATPPEPAPPSETPAESTPNSSTS